MDVAEVERMLVEATRTWHERLYTALEDELKSTEAAKSLLKTYGDAFPASYIEYYRTPQAAAKDALLMEPIDEDRNMNMALYRLPEDDPAIIRIKLFRLAEPIPLSNILPILENFIF